MLSSQNKSRTRQKFCHFSICKRAQLPATRITEQPTLRTKSKINRLCYKFFKYFCQNGKSNLVLVLVLVLESKALYQCTLAQFKRRTFHEPNLIPIWVSLRSRVEERRLGRERERAPSLSLPNALSSRRLRTLINLGRFIWVDSND